MKTLLRFTTSFSLMGVILFSACRMDIDSPSNPEQELVTWTVQADRVASTETTTAVIFTFSSPVTDLSATHISLTNDTGAVTKGALSGGENTWTLGISVQTAGNVKVKISKEGIEAGEKTLRVSRKPDITYTAAADGVNNTADSTKITFTFNEAVTGLSEGDITLTNNGGEVTKGALSGEGETWTLGITVQKAGEVKVKISKDGIDPGEKPVDLFKAGEITLITYTAAADGSSTATSTAITLSFGAAVTGLSEGDITLTNDSGGVTKGGLTGEGQTWTLGISVQTAGNVKVSINKAGIDPGEKTVEVKVREPDITYTAQADGVDNTTDSTAITFSFDKGVAELTAEQISLTNGTGAASKGTISGRGTSWTLGVTVQTAGDLKVSINKAGIEGTEKTVTVHKAPAAVPPGPAQLTKAIDFASEEYRSGTEFDNTQWTGQGTENEGWALSAGAEQHHTYFAVYKAATQTITVGGTDAAKVSMAASGDFVSEATDEGLSASDTFAVFTVKTGDLVFEGGTRTFALEVSEEGALPLTVTVNLKVETNHTGAGVFKLAEKAGDVEYLDRVGGDFDGLVSAFTWVENNAEADTEYTIRVEQDETDLPHLIVSLHGAEGASLRLKGTKDGPWKLEPGEVTSGAVKGIVNEGSLMEVDGFIQIGNTFTFSRKTFILGKNITIQSGNLQGISSSYTAVLYAGYNATLVLEPGSTITNHNMESTRAVIRIDGAYNNTDSTKHGKLRILGGAITNCTIHFDANKTTNNPGRGLILFYSAIADFTEGSFYLAPGNVLILSNNFAGASGTTDLVVFYGDSKHFTTYSLSEYLGAGASWPPLP